MMMDDGLIHVDPLIALLYVERMHQALHKIEEKPEDTILLSLTLRELLLLHAGVTFFQVHYGCLDQVVNPFMYKIDEVIGAQVGDDWTQRLIEELGS